MITRAARFGVLKNFMNGMNIGTSSGMVFSGCATVSIATIDTLEASACLQDRFCRFCRRWRRVNRHEFGHGSSRRHSGTKPPRSTWRHRWRGVARRGQTGRHRWRGVARPRLPSCPRERSLQSSAPTCNLRRKRSERRATFERADRLIVRSSNEPIGNTGRRLCWQTLPIRARASVFPWSPPLRWISTAGGIECTRWRFVLVPTAKYEPEAPARVCSRGHRRWTGGSPSQHVPNRPAPSHFPRPSRASRPAWAPD